MPDNEKVDDSKMMKDDEADDDDDEKGNGMFMCFLITIIVLFLAGVVDSLTTKFFHKGCVAFAAWTMDNAPWSFVAFEFVIFLFVLFCVPYGPLSVLSGALFYQKYKKNGIVIAWIALVFVCFSAAIIAFYLARNYFKETVQKKVAKNPKLKFLRNLDKLIEAGQGLDMVILIRVAPFPNGPTNYFLGTTAVTWRDFLVGSMVVGMPECLMDVCIGAGANEVDFSNPKSLALFVVLVAVGMGFICYVGNKANKMLAEIDDEDKDKDGEKEELDPDHIGNRFK